MRLTYTLPYPPSVNTYWRVVNGRPILSARGRTYRLDVAAAVLTLGVPPRFAGRLAVEVEAFPPDLRVRDLDNIGKGILDALAHAGLYDDDGQIDDLRFVRRGPLRPGGCVVVTVGEIER